LSSPICSSTSSFSQSASNASLASGYWHYHLTHFQGMLFYK
jgi:hypothetical protein